MSATDVDTVHEIAEQNRRRAAELLAGLTEEQWRTPSLCAGWTVREVAGHLLEPLETRLGALGLVWALVRHRGSLDRMVDDRARRTASRPTEALVAGLREHAAVRLDPPVIGPYGPMCDSLVHLRDIARPLGLDVGPPVEHWRVALDFLARPTSATKALVPADRISGLRLVASDQEWRHGDGAELRGPSEAIAMAITGRSVALPDLVGPGVQVLFSRLT